MNEYFLSLYIIFFILIYFVEKKLYQSHISPLTFYCLLWCIIGIGANLAFFDYDKPSLLVNITIIASIAIVFVFFIIMNKNISFQLLGNLIIEFILNKTLFFLLEVILIFVSIPKFRNSFQILLTNGFTILRGAEIIGVGKDVGIYNEIVELIVKPWFYCVDLIAIISLFNKFSKIDKKFLWILNIFNIVYFVIMTAGRAFLVNTIFYYLITLLIYRRKNLYAFIKKEKVKLLLFILIIIGLLIMQNLRSPDMTIIKTFYIYYFSGPIYLSKIINVNSTVFSINKQFLYGSATFGFITSLFSYMAILISHTPQGAGYLISSKLTSSNVLIGKNIKINSMCTSSYIFLLDWGYFGIIVGPLVISVFSYIIYNRAIKKPTLANIAILVFFINVLIRTVFKWDLLYSDICIIYFYLRIITYFSKVRIKWY